MSMINDERHDIPTHGVPVRKCYTRDQRFHHGLDASVVDFWEYAFPDLQMNTLRGAVAEFIVARALGVSVPRVEWEPYDVLSPEGIRVEVKCGAYLQAWEQKKLSSIVFTRLCSRVLDPSTNDYVAERSYNADVYVFAVQTALEHRILDILNLQQWEFYVLSRERLEATGQVSLTLEATRQIARGPLSFADLGEAVRTVCGGRDIPAELSRKTVRSAAVPRKPAVPQRPAVPQKTSPRPQGIFGPVDISPQGVGHLPGCKHKDDPDMSRWGQATYEGAWQELRDGKLIVADSGANVGLMARFACKTCVNSLRNGA